MGRGAATHPATGSRLELGRGLRLGLGRVMVRVWGRSQGTHPVVAGLEAPDAAVLHLQAPHDPACAAGLQVRLRLGVPEGADLRQTAGRRTSISACPQDLGSSVWRW